MQSYLHLSAKQQIDKNYQLVYKKLGKVIQSLISKDETTFILKYLENMVKDQENVTTLKDDTLIKAVQLPNLLSTLGIPFAKVILRMPHK